MPGTAHGSVKPETTASNKKGSITVFICITLPVLIAMTLALIYAGREMSAVSRADSIMNLAGYSLLSEYDSYVQDEYGLFLVNVSDELLTRKLKSYVGFSTASMEDMNLNSCRVSSRGYAVVEPAMIENQIMEFMKHPSAVSAAITDKREKNTMTEHTLRHGPTKVSLPSRELPDSNFIDKVSSFGNSISSGDNLLKEGTDEYLMGSYILTIFNSETTLRNSEHFFRNEVEYIMSGKYSDEENLKAAGRAIRALRTGPNLAHIYSDPTKLASVTAAAEAVTPGPLGTLTALGIATAWAAVESANDFNLLKSGHRVPLVKDNLSWATDLDGVISGVLSEDSTEAIVPQKESGLRYDEYMRILLTIKDDNLVTARILDLVQINMRKSHDNDFLIGDCAAVLSIKATINDRDFSYDKKY